MPELDGLFEKIGASAILVLLLSLCGGYIFFSLIKHFVLKYFESIHAKVDACFRRIDEQRSDLASFKNLDYRDYKRDVAIAISQNREDIKALFDRTDNHSEVKDCVAFCHRKNKIGSDNEHN